MKTLTERNCKGQVLLIAMLLISLILISTITYIYEVGKSFKEFNLGFTSDFVFNIVTSSRHVLVSSLANITNNDGANTVLSTNLERWKFFIGKQQQLGKCILNFSLVEVPQYLSGVWIFWGSNGTGVSSACVNFTLYVIDINTDIELPYTHNVTTTLLICGSYEQMQGNWKEVNVTCNLLNEDKPALAENLTVFYKSSEGWVALNQSDSFMLVDYGNGTYFATFMVEISMEEVEVSVQARDYRGITVQANVTCREA